MIPAIDPVMLMKIMPHIAKVVEKITGKKTGLPEMLQIMPEITKAFKDPSIGDKLKKIPDNKEEVPAPKIPKDKDTVSSGRYTSGIGNLLKINPETFNWGKPPLGRSISPLSGINNLFESSW